MTPGAAENVTPIRLPSRAKINLGLRVGAARSDGFHDIETVLHEIELCDHLEFAPGSGLRLHCSTPDLPTSSRNLVVRAAWALAGRTGIEPQALIELEKNIPLGSGLGGGSSNAACTLQGLNRFWTAGLSRESLRSLAGDVGSDVPFFLEGGTQLATGRGEILRRIETDLVLELVLVYPGFGVSSSWAYGATDLKLTKTDMRTTILVDGLRSGDLRAVSDGLFNDLEPAVTRKHPELRDLKKELLGFGCLGASMTGSGSAVFGICRDRRHALRAAERLAARGCWARATRSWKGGGPADRSTSG